MKITQEVEVDENAVVPGHNPDGVKWKELGVEDGYRLLPEKYIFSWSPVKCGHFAPGTRTWHSCTAYTKGGTFRTKATDAELDEVLNTQGWHEISDEVRAKFYNYNYRTERKGLFSYTTYSGKRVLDTGVPMNWTQYTQYYTRFDECELYNIVRELDRTAEKSEWRKITEDELRILKTAYIRDEKFDWSKFLYYDRPVAVGLSFDGAPDCYQTMLTPEEIRVLDRSKKRSTPWRKMSQIEVIACRAAKNQNRTTWDNSVGDAFKVDGMTRPHFNGAMNPDTCYVTTYTEEDLLRLLDTTIKK